MEIFLLALLFDLVIGDNLGDLHPVVLIGLLITSLEKKLIRLKQVKIAGFVFAISVIAISSLTTYFLLALFSFNSVVYTLISGFIISTTFAFRGLLSAGFKVYSALKANDIKKARKLLANIVGRDTSSLNHEQIIKATIESLAENTVDGVTAPLFYALIGGAPLAIMYRSINTLDSMVGYKNDRYNKFGLASAKIDDIANFIPARITLVFIWIASFLCGLKFKECIKTSVNDGKKHLSPNSGLSEAAFAGALSIELGGIAYYEGAPVNLASFGPSTASADLGHIRSSLWLVTISSTSFLTLLMFLGVIIR